MVQLAPLNHFHERQGIMSLGLAIGLAHGLSYGIVMHNLILGLVLGVGIGVPFGARLQQHYQCARVAAAFSRHTRHMVSIHWD